MKRLLFYSVRLPGIYGLMVIGIVIDAIVQLPFLVLCTIENFFRNRPE